MLLLSDKGKGQTDLVDFDGEGEELKISVIGSISGGLQRAEPLCTE